MHRSVGKGLTRLGLENKKIQGENVEHLIIGRLANRRVNDEKV